MTSSLTFTDMYSYKLAKEYDELIFKTFASHGYSKEWLLENIERVVVFMSSGPVDTKAYTVDGVEIFRTVTHVDGVNHESDGLFHLEYRIDVIDAKEDM